MKRIRNLFYILCPLVLISLSGQGVKSSDGKLDFKKSKFKLTFECSKKKKECQDDTNDVFLNPVECSELVSTFDFLLTNTFVQCTKQTLLKSNLKNRGPPYFLNV